MIARLDTDGSSTPQLRPAPFTLDRSTATDEVVDSFGIVWREQVVPPLDAEDTALLQAFLGARLAGEGAEGTCSPDQSGPKTPLCRCCTPRATRPRMSDSNASASPTGTCSGWTKVEVRMFAVDGTVVEQRFHGALQDGQFGLVYGYDDVPTTANWQTVPESFGILGGEVTFAAAATKSEFRFRKVREIAHGS